MVNVLAADVWMEGGGLIVGARPVGVVKWLLMFGKFGKYKSGRL